MLNGVESSGDMLQWLSIYIRLLLLGKAFDNNIFTEVLVLVGMF